MLENHQGEILVSKRKQSQIQGGLWEFPGGKIEANETTFAALQREVQEELAYTLKTAKQFYCVTHNYETYTVELEFWQAQDNHPKIYANENQQLQWLKKIKLSELPMPKANQGLIKKLLK